MLLELNHMVMAVRDLTACRTLYGGSLGLEEIGTNGEGTNTCCYRVGPTVLELQQQPAASAPASREETLPAIDHFAFYAASIDRTYASLKDLPVGLLGPPQATAVGHRNMQRSLLALQDPNGFTLQISETIDPRSHLEGRRVAKRNMAAATEASGPFGGIDHIAMYCTDYGATRSFYVETLELEEFFHSTIREEGTTVAPGFEQGAFAVGGTDIEMATDDTWTAVGPGVVVQLGFATADVDRAHSALLDSGIAPDGPPRERALYPSPSRRTFTLRDPDGLKIQISE